MGQRRGFEPSPADLIAVARAAIVHHPDARGLDDAAAVARYRESLAAHRAVAAERERHPVLARLGDLIDRSRALASPLRA